MAFSLDQFAQQILDSGVLSADELAAARSGSTAADAEQLARELVKRKVLTAYQAQQLYAGRGKGLVLGNFSSSTSSARGAWEWSSRRGTGGWTAWSR